MRPTDDIDGRDDGIENHVRQTRVFADCKVCFALVRAKVQVEFPDMVQGGIQETEFSRDKNRCGAVKNEVAGNEGEGLAGPWTSSGRVGDACVAPAGMWILGGTRLAVFRDAGPGEGTETDPVVGGIGSC